MHLAKYFVGLLLVVAMTLQVGCSNSDYSVSDSAETESADVMVVDAELVDDTAATVVADTGQGEADSPEPTLLVGSVAPPLEIPTWISGNEVGSFETGKTYVVEFWATWCGPCRASMPHLSKLQEEYGDAVTFIGISDEDQGTVDGFFAKTHDDEQTWGELISYSIAIDPSRKAHEDYMQAARQSGIPTAFIVGPDGFIEWIGHPMKIDSPLAKVADGTWDREAEAAHMRQQMEAQARMQRAAGELRAAQAAGDYDKALEIVDALISDMPQQAQLKMAKIGILTEAGRTEDASKVIGEVAEEHWEEAGFLNGLAWAMATEIDGADLDQALKIGQQANELTDGKDGSILDTIARIYFEQDDLPSAVAWQEKAVAISSDLQSTLDKYKKALNPSEKPDEPAEEESELSEDEGNDSEEEEASVE